MPNRRHPELQLKLETWANQKLSGPDAYKRYLDEGVPELINREPVSYRRFLNIYYAEKKKIESADSESEYWLQGNPAELIGLDSNLLEHREIKDSIFAENRWDEIYLSAVQEMYSFYRKYRLSYLFDGTVSSIKKPDINTFKWYIRLKHLSLNSEFESHSQQMVSMVKKLRILGSELLAEWENLMKSGVACRRPKVENLFLLEFWKLPISDFERILKLQAPIFDFSKYHSNFKDALDEFDELWIHSTESRFSDYYDIDIDETTSYCMRPFFNNDHAFPARLANKGLVVQIYQDGRNKNVTNPFTASIKTKLVENLINFRYPLTYTLVNAQTFGVGQPATMLDIAKDDILKETATKLVKLDETDSSQQKNDLDALEIELKYM